MLGIAGEQTIFFNRLLHIDTPALTNQQKFRFISSVSRLGAIKRTYQVQWLVETEGEGQRNTYGQHALMMMKMMIHSHPWTYIHTYICTTYTHTYPYKYAHTHTHTYIYTNICYVYMHTYSFRHGSAPCVTVIDIRNRHNNSSSHPEGSHMYFT